jgi:hypothetical protein
MEIYPALSAYNVFGDAVATTGTATVWGAQIQTGGAVTIYIPTTTAIAQQPTSYTVKPGDVVRIQTDKTKRFGLDNGKNVMVVSARSRFLANVVDFVAWGG